MKSRAVVSAAALAALGVGLATQGQAQSSAPARSGRPRNACFDAHMINGFNAPNESTVYIRVGVDEIWRLKLLGDCPNMNWDQRIALQNRSGSSFICDALDTEVLAHDPGMGLQRCPVSELHRLTPEEAAALPKKDRP